MRRQAEHQDPAVHYVDGAVTQDFAELLVGLAGAWDAKLSELRIRIYAQALNGVPVSVLKSVFDRLVREATYFPTVAEILKYIQPAAEDAPLLAWTALERAASAVGSWSDLVVDDQVAASALLQVFGSWTTFCTLEDGPARTLKRQEFIAAYRTLARDKFRQGARMPVVLRGQLALADSPQRSGWTARLQADGTLTLDRAQLPSVAPARPLLSGELP